MIPLQICVLDLGVLISGGYNGQPLQFVEIYNPVSNTTCYLPQLPERRDFLTQDGELACGGWGGGNTDLTCVKFSSNSGTWTESHSLRQRRAYHVSWDTKDGVYLMGGADFSSSHYTTDLVKEDGTVENGFSLKYDTQ